MRRGGMWVWVSINAFIFCQFPYFHCKGPLQKLLVLYFYAESKAAILRGQILGAVLKLETLWTARENFSRNKEDDDVDWEGWFVVCVHAW